MKVVATLDCVGLLPETPLEAELLRSWASSAPRRADEAQHRKIASHKAAEGFSNVACLVVAFGESVAPVRVAPFPCDNFDIRNALNAMRHLDVDDWLIDFRANLIQFRSPSRAASLGLDAAMQLALDWWYREGVVADPGSG